MKSKFDFNNTKIDWEKVDRVIDGSNKILLTTHENPDGDGLGSQCGIYYHLIEYGKDVRIINYSKISEEYYFMNHDNIFEQYDSEKHDEWIKSIDLVIIFDVGDYKRIRTLCDVVSKYNLKIMNIDHHPHPVEHNFDYNIIDLKAAATGSMVYDYLKFKRKKTLPKKSLTGIYTAVMTDTGCFRHSNTDIKSHKIAIECLDIGVETNLIYQRIYENSSKARVKLMGLVLSKINYEFDGNFAWFAVTKKMMSKANAVKSDVEGFSDMVRSIKGVEVALMIAEQSEQECRINFRSKGKLKINHIAESFGGGGHAYASGAKLKGTIGELREKIVKQTMKFLKPEIEKIS